MSPNKIHKLKSLFTAGGSGCGCRPKPADIIEPQTKSKPSDQKSSLLPSSSATSSAESHRGKSAAEAEDDAWSSTTFSLTADASPNSFPPKINDSFAVVKDSDDPYHDFRQSMLQMICEKKIYSTNDLQQLLDCFLRLNSPRHHEVIVRAFVEIWRGGGGKETAAAGAM